MSVTIRVTAGSGGNESEDFARMLRRMYRAWAEDLGMWATEDNGVVSLPDRARVLATESGVHRLIRNSPFDPQRRRHTSFAQVNVFVDDVMQPSPPDEFGQRRSYVLDPYQMAKDHVTGKESTDPGRVLSGDLSLFVEAIETCE